MPVEDEQIRAIKETLSKVLSDVRPSEVILVDDIFTPTKSVSTPLGFGTGAEVVLLIHPLLGVLKELGKTAAEGFAKKWGESLATLIWSERKPDKVLTLDPNALRFLRRAVIDRLEKDRIVASDCERVADSLVSLFIARPALLRKIVVTKSKS
jgi:hypothetical protein